METHIFLNEIKDNKSENFRILFPHIFKFVTVRICAL